MHRPEARNWMIVAIALATLAWVTAPALANDARSDVPIETSNVDLYLDLPDPDEPPPGFDSSWREVDLPPTLTGLVMTFSQRNPVVAAPLPPAVLSGGVLLAGQWIFSIVRKRRA